MATAEKEIYDRLAAAPTFHPASAALFANDWALDPGDVVAVKSGEDTFSVPIYGMTLDWKGNSMVEIQSTGNEERKPISALKRRQFASGRGRYRQEKEIDGYYQRLIEEHGSMGLIAGALGVVLDDDGNPVTDPTTGKLVYDENSPAEMFSRLLTTPNYAELVSALNNGTQQISGAKINLSSQGTVLIQAINNRPSGQGAVTIEADKIDLRGYVTTSYIDAEKAVVDALISSSGYSGSMSVTGTVSAGTVAAGYVQGSQLWLLDNNGDRYAQITDSGIKGLQIVPPPEGSNVYTLQKQTFLSGNTWLDVGTFSRATSLNGAWSGGTYTVTATPQGNTESTSPVLKGSGNGSDNFAVVLRETDSSTTDLLSKRIYLKSVTGAVNACENSDGTGILGTIRVSGGGGYTPADIRIGNITNESGSHSIGDGTLLNDLGSAISRAGSRTYVRFIADLNGYSGSGKVYYIPIN